MVPAMPPATRRKAPRRIGAQNARSPIGAAKVRWTVTELEMIGQMAVEIRKLRDELLEQSRVCTEQRKRLMEYERESQRNSEAIRRVFAAASTADMRRKLQVVYEAAMGETK